MNFEEMDGEQDFIQSWKKYLNTLLSKSTNAAMYKYCLKFYLSSSSKVSLTHQNKSSTLVRLTDKVVYLRSLDI